MKAIDLSVVIPVYNERENIEPLYRELKSVLDGLGLNYEIIFVNDGSTDGSAEVLDRLAEADEKIVVVHFRRNFGQTAALSAGFEEARGEVVVTMDADLQNDPADIPKLLEKLKEGYDIVSGWRKNRRDPFFSRVLPSRVANWIISKVTGVSLHDYGCTLKAYRREVVKDLNLYGEQHRFIPALASEMGVKIAEIPVNHRPRLRGKSKYGMSRIFKVILDLVAIKFLLSYKSRPIRIFGGLGFGLWLLGFVPFCYLVLKKLILGASIGHRPLLLISVFLMLVGIQLVSMGLLGEFMVRAYFESQGKKPYYILKVVRRT